MKVIRLEIENLKKIKAINIKPITNVVKIEGKNAQGKSTTLDAIEYVLTGKKSDDMVRHGEEKAVIKLETDSFNIERVYKKDKTPIIKLKNNEGELIKRPQEFLDSMVGSIAVDPIKFLNLTSQEQKKILCSCIGFDIDKYEEEYKSIFTDRTYQKKRLKDIEANLKQYEDIEEVEKVSVIDLVKEKDVIEVFNNEQIILKNKIEDIKNERQEQKDIWDNYSKQIEDIKIEMDKILEHTVKLDEQLLTIIPKEEKDTSEIIKKIEDSQSINEKASKYEKKIELQLELNKQNITCEKLEKDIVNKKDELLNAIQKANILPSLEVREDGVFYNGVSLNESSTAEKLKISTLIAMKLNPLIKVILIRSGNDLDNESMEQLERIAIDNDYQIWIERIKENPTENNEGIYIYDGEVMI